MFHVQWRSQSVLPCSYPHSCDVFGPFGNRHFNTHAEGLRAVLELDQVNLLSLTPKEQVAVQLGLSNLVSASVADAEFVGMNFDGVKFIGVQENVTYQNCSFVGARLHLFDWRDVKFIDCDFTDAIVFGSHHSVSANTYWAWGETCYENDFLGDRDFPQEIDRDRITPQFDRDLTAEELAKGVKSFTRIVWFLGLPWVFAGGQPRLYCIQDKQPMDIYSDGSYFRSRCYQGECVQFVRVDKYYYRSYQSQGIFLPTIEFPMDKWFTSTFEQCLEQVNSENDLLPSYDLLLEYSKFYDLYEQGLLESLPLKHYKKHLDAGLSQKEAYRLGLEEYRSGFWVKTLTKAEEKFLRLAVSVLETKEAISEKMKRR